MSTQKSISYQNKKDVPYKKNCDKPSTFKKIIIERNYFQPLKKKS